MFGFKPNQNNTTMAKNTKTSPATKPSLAKAPVETTPVAVPAETKRSKRGVVLKALTASEIRELVGEDTKIGVSIKSLKAAVLAQTSAKALAAAGL